PWTEHRRVPGRGPRQDPARLGRFGAGRNPVGVRRDGLGRQAGASSTDDQDAHSCAAPCAPEEFSPVHSLAKGYRAVGGHLGSPSVPFRDGKDPSGYWLRVRRTCRVRTAKSSGISSLLSVDVSTESSAVLPSAEVPSILPTYSQYSRSFTYHCV